MRLAHLCSCIWFDVIGVPLIMLGAWTAFTPPQSISADFATPQFFGGMWLRGVGLFRGEGTIPFLLIWALVLVVLGVGEALWGRKA